jgi:8-oxo-dGTP pyrophosphatase MutT (NUDIX family)
MHASLPREGASAPLDAAGVVVYRRVGGGSLSFLLLRCARAGHWTPPKGHLDRGEDERSAALRETREEAALGVEELQLDRAFRFEITYQVVREGAPYAKRVVYFLAELTAGASVSLSSEHDEFAWLGAQRACERVGFPSLQEVIHAAARHLDRRG